MNKNMLGSLTQIRPSKATLGRLKHIKTIFEELSVERLSKAAMAGNTGLSPSGVRKNLRVLVDAGVLVQHFAACVRDESTYSITTDTDRAEEFARQLDELIAASEDHVAGIKPWMSVKQLTKQKEEQSKLKHSRLLSSYEYAPGRRIYTSAGCSLDAMRALSMQQMKIDPMRQAGLL